MYEVNLHSLLRVPYPLVLAGPGLVLPCAPLVLHFTFVPNGGPLQIKDVDARSILSVDTHVAMQCTIVPR